MRRVDVTKRYLKDLKLARKRSLPEDKLNTVVFMLANDEPLPEKNHDHQLYGDFAGMRECHIEPDWLLIYSKEDQETLRILTLVRTGSHSDLFGKTRR